MERVACGKQGWKPHLGSVEQGQEPYVCAAAAGSPLGPIGPTSPLHHACSVHGTWGLCHMTSLGDVPGNSLRSPQASNGSI